MNYMKYKRIIASIVDMFLSTFLCVLILFISTLFFTEDTSYSISFFCAFIFFLLKDVVIDYGSIGKKIVGIELVSNNNKSISLTIKVLRNLSLVLWPIELIVFLFTGRRIGDYLFGTKCRTGVLID